MKNKPVIPSNWSTEKSLNLDNASPNGYQAKTEQTLKTESNL